jgi:phosphomannomutase
MRFSELQHQGLMISVSGVRGIVGESLTPEICTRLGAAFGTFVDGGTVVVGRDTRLSGEMVKHAVFSGLLSAGCQVIDIGVVATPSLSLMIDKLHADGGVMISASHNPVEWNALKFFNKRGLYLNDGEGKELMAFAENRTLRRARWDGIPAVISNNDAVENHVACVLRHVNVPLIKSRRFKVALDCVNGAGVDVALRLLAALGCEVHPIHCQPNGLFPHYPEPNFINLQDLRNHSAERKVDVGFALDPDGDRLALVDSKGRFLGEETTLPLCVKHILKTQKGSVVVNMSTSRTTNDVCIQAGVQFERVPVGEIFVAERMAASGAVFGGEGNGGIIDPRLHYGRDALIGMALILESMAMSNKAVGELADELPKYSIVKAKIECSRERIMSVLETLKTDSRDAKVNIQDGLRLDWPGRWVHLRPSNTEPIMRIIAEAESESAAKQLVADFSERVEGILALLHKD